MIFLIYFDLYYATASALMQLCLNKNDSFFGFCLLVKHLHLKSVRPCVTLGPLASLKAVVMGINTGGSIVLCGSMLLWEQQAIHMPSVDVAPQAQPLASTKACPRHYTVSVISLQCYTVSSFEILHRMLMRSITCYDLWVNCHKKKKKMM